MSLQGPLSRRQRFSYSIRCASRRPSDDINYNMEKVGDPERKGGGGISHTQSFSFETQSAESSSIGRLWQSTGNLLFNKSKDNGEAKADRSVRFKTSVKVVLIPARQDYERAELSKSLWWDQHDFEDFKMDAVGELKATMVTLNLSGRDASIVLYQGLEADLNNAQPKTSSISRAGQVLEALRGLVTTPPVPGKSAPIEIVMPLSPEDKDQHEEHKLFQLRSKEVGNGGREASESDISDAEMVQQNVRMAAQLSLPDRAANTGPSFEREVRNLEGAMSASALHSPSTTYPSGDPTSSSHSFPNDTERFLSSTTSLYLRRDYKYDQTAQKIVATNSNSSISSSSTSSSTISTGPSRGKLLASKAKEVMLTRSRGENSDHCVKRTWSSDSNTSRVKQPAIALKTHVQSAARSVYMSEGSPVQEA